MKTHLVIPDTHAHWKHNNDRADWLAGLIGDVRPDVVVHIGDSADLPSLSSYDKGKRGFHGRTYRADIDAHLDFQHRIWEPIRRAKKRLPRRVFLIGNHEQRIEKALDLSPELEGTISLRDLDLTEWYNDIVPYDGNTPGRIEIDGVWYAHYFSSGVMGRAIGGEHPATSLLAKRFSSSTCGHLHLADWSIRTTNDRKIMGMFVGCYQDYRSDWAGDANELWWSGVVIKRGVHNGQYDPEFISIQRLKEEYGTK
jgi:hypothetical protein